MKKLISVVLPSLLTGRVKILFVVLLFVVAFLASAVFAYNMLTRFRENSQLSYPASSSLQDIKKSLAIPKGFLKRELNLPLENSNKNLMVDKNVSLETINYKLKRAQLRYYAQDLKKSLFFTLSFFGLMMLIYVSRRNQNPLVSKPRLGVRRFYVPVLLFSVLIGGFVLGKSPNPMEAVVKGVKTIFDYHSYSISNIILLLLFVIVSIVGNKIICGWACPFGAFQELTFIFSSKIKKHTLPFYLTNSVRGLIFLLSLFGLFGGGAGLMIYHYINPFNVFIPYFKPTLILISILFFLGASLFFYRPFCQFVCPFGLVSWVLEKVSIFKVRIDHQKCIKCKICYKSCPTGAIQSKVMNDKIPKECFSCGRCLDKCPVHAIRYD